MILHSTLNNIKTLLPTIRESCGKAQQDGHGEVYTESKSYCKHANQHIAYDQYSLTAFTISNSSPYIAACDKWN